MPTIERNRAKILKRLAQDGWAFDRAGGEHDLYGHPERSGVVAVPRHRTVSPGVARSISKAAGWH